MNKNNNIIKIYVNNKECIKYILGVFCPFYNYCLICKQWFSSCWFMHNLTDETHKAEIKKHENKYNN